MSLTNSPFVNRETHLQMPVDSIKGYWQNNFCCIQVRRYLSWIEGLTANQYVGGSNPSRRTICGIFCVSVR
jgi:hypothetical protein